MFSRGYSNLVKGLIEAQKVTIHKSKVGDLRYVQFYKKTPDIIYDLTFNALFHKFYLAFF